MKCKGCDAQLYCQDGSPNMNISTKYTMKENMCDSCITNVLIASSHKCCRCDIKINTFHVYPKLNKQASVVFARYCPQCEAHVSSLVWAGLRRLEEGKREEQRRMNGQFHQQREKRHFELDRYADSNHHLDSNRYLDSNHYLDSNRDIELKRLRRENDEKTKMLKELQDAADKLKKHMMDNMTMPAMPYYPLVSQSSQSSNQPIYDPALPPNIANYCPTSIVEK